MLTAYWRGDVEVSSYRFPPLFSFIVQKLSVSGRFWGSVMSVCCSSALEEPAVSVEPVAVLKPSKASPKPLVRGGRAATGLRAAQAERILWSLVLWAWKACVHHDSSLAGLTTEKNECVGYLSFIWARILGFIVARLDCRSGRGAAMQLLIATASSA